MVNDEPDIVNRSLLAALNVSTTVPVADPDLSCMLPVPRAIDSLNVSAILLATATLVAPSVGLNVATVGAVKSIKSR